MIRSIALNILDKDAGYIKALVSVIAADHPGYTVSARSTCGGDCPEETDVCLRFEPLIGSSEGSCGKALEPSCGRYAGLKAILREVKSFVLDTRKETLHGQAPGHNCMPFAPGKMICVYSYAGGAGASFSAIGIGRELARYRGERVIYLSLENIEDTSLCPAGLCAMSAEETLYRYFKLVSKEGPAGEFDRLFAAAASCDEYGLFRFAGDAGLNSLAGLSLYDLYHFLTRLDSALGLTRIVLDFGTRLHFLSSFSALADEDEAVFINILAPGTDHKQRGKQRADSCFLKEKTLITTAFSRDIEYVRHAGDGNEITLGGTFGHEIKEVCDKILR